MWAVDAVLKNRRRHLLGDRLQEHIQTFLKVAVHALHLLQSCLVYVNTLMLQRVLAEPAWLAHMTPADARALTPLVWAHVSPYGTFDLDMERRLDLEVRKAA